MPHVALPEQELVHRLEWFIRVRWLFVAGLAYGILFGKFLFGLQFPTWAAATVGAVILLYNALFLASHRWVRHRDRTPDLASARTEAGLQIGLDLLALTVLIHLAGGVESPFICLYIIHAIVGSMLLSRRAAWLVGLTAFGLFLSVVLLEHLGVLPHFDPAGYGHARGNEQAPFLAVFCVAFLVSLASTIWITTAIVNGLRLREHQLVLTQQALIRKSDDLARACASLTEQQKQLVQTEKQASLGQLVAGIAHEINNPIQFIHGNMAILSEAFGDVLPLLDEQEVRRPGLRIARLDYAFFRKHVTLLLRDMSDGAARIGAIVRDLKTFARRDEGRLDENVDLNEVVAASVRLLHNHLKRFRVEQDLDPALPALRGNVTQLQQVAVNVLQNAAQALNGSAHGTIRVRTQLDGGGERVRLTIEDDGCGIAPDVKDRIFDPFFTTKQRFGGTGLGLAITYGIIQQHQGQIEVDTSVGKGTAFHFLLPVRRKELRCAS
jgi:signal transduction histidine kinase